MSELRKNVKDGERRKALFGIADLLVATLEQADPKDVSSLARQLRETLKDIANLPQVTEKDVVDELVERRASRLAKAADRKPPAGTKQRGKRGGTAS